MPAASPPLVTPVPPSQGGTGIANNGASTLTISGSFSLALTISAGTSITLPTSGTIATLIGSESFSNKTFANNTIFTASLLLATGSLVTWNSDAILGRKAAASIRLGASGSATPVAQTLSSTDSRGGTDTNVGGGNLTIAAGTGTGTGTLATLSLQAPIAGASGTVAQTQVTGLTIIGGASRLTSYTVATLPVASTIGAGGRAFITDGSTTFILGLGLLAVGGGANKVPVYSDGTNWIVG